MYCLSIFQLTYDFEITMTNKIKTFKQPTYSPLLKDLVVIRPSQQNNLELEQLHAYNTIKSTSCTSCTNNFVSDVNPK